MGKTSTTITLSTALDVFSENIPDIKSTLLSLVADRINTVEHEHTFFKPRNSFERDIWNECVKYSIEQATETPRKVLKRITAREQHALTPHNNYITDDDIERAREYPIRELYDGKLQKIHTGYRGLCPFSPEKTASFFIRTKDNKFKCFGCGAYGDAISYYMRVHNMTSKEFPKAVRVLSSK